MIGDPEAGNPIASPDVNNLTELKDSINSISHLTAKIVNNRLQIIADNGYTFSFSDDNSGVLSALGINTFFKGEKYNLNPPVNVMSYGDSTNSDSLTYVGIFDEKKLTGHEYDVTYDGTNLKIKDLFTGEYLDPSKYTTEVEDGRLTIKFDGIKLQINNSNFTGPDTFHVRNITSSSIYNDELVDNHEYMIDFTSGTDLLSITDLTENETLTSNDYELKDIDINNDATPDFVAIKIKKTGMTITLKKGTYGIIKIKPQLIGAKNITTKLNEDDIFYLNAGKVNSITYDDTQSTTKVHDIEVTDFSKLKRMKYTIVADGLGNYTITDENGNSVSPSSQGTNFVEFDGIRINFSGNTASGDLIIVHGNLLDFSSGDNRIASEIANLRDKKVMNDNSSSITESYSNLLGEIGVDKNFIKNRLDASKISEEGLMKQRDSISGVSIDEELTKLIQTQHSYIASAKLLTVVDRLTQYLLNSV